MFPMFPFLLIVLCLVFLLVVMGPMTTPESRRRPHREEISHKRAFDILSERLAKGEIDKSEYDEKRRTIVQGR